MVTGWFCFKSQKVWFTSWVLVVQALNDWLYLHLVLQSCCTLQDQIERWAIQTIISAVLQICNESPKIMECYISQRWIIPWTLDCHWNNSYTPFQFLCPFITFDFHLFLCAYSLLKWTSFVTCTLYRRKRTWTGMVFDIVCKFYVAYT